MIAQWIVTGRCSAEFRSTASEARANAAWKTHYGHASRRGRGHLHSTHSLTTIESAR